MHTCRLNAIPYTILLDKERNIIAINLSQDKLMNFVTWDK